jgi:hypothetical protein
MPLSVWSVVLWISGFALNLALFAVLIYKKRYRTLPLFTLLIGLDSVQTIVLFSVHRYASLNVYSYAWYISEAVDTVLHLLVVWEVARILIEQHLGLRLHEEIRNHWIAFLLMAVLGIFFLTYPDHATYLPAVIALRGGQLSTVGIGGLLLMVLGLTFFFRVNVRIHSQAIVYGLALYTFGKFIVEGAFLLLGTDIVAQSNDWLRPVYHVTLLFWIVCLWRKEPERALSDSVYALVRQGRAGINPPMPKSVTFEERSRSPRRLVFSIREKKVPPDSGNETLERDPIG